MRNLMLVSLAIVLSLGAFGCKGAGMVYQLRDAPIQTATGKEPTLDEVQKAIVGAGAGLGWQMTVPKPGEIIGTLNIRSHQAVVSIPYTTKGYSILYKDSSNLQYDAQAQTIHPNYTIWIRKLDDAIRTRLTTAG